MSDSMVAMVDRLTRAGLDPFSMTLRKCLATHQALQEKDSEDFAAAVRALREEGRR